MAKGQVFTIANQAAVLKTTQVGSEKQSLAILNPNDGVLYIALDRIADNSYGGWDWKLPSQSYALFPGPWTSVGLYYLDQSGAGVAGEFNLYDADTRLEIPDIRSIGRALQARQNTLDVTEGNQPPNPSLGVARVWADNSGMLNLLESDGSGGRIGSQNLWKVGGMRGYALAPIADIRGGSQAAGISASVNTWASISGVYSFTKLLAITDLLVQVRYGGYIVVPAGGPASINLAWSIDPPAGAGVGGIFDYFGNVSAPTGSTWFFMASTVLRVTGVTAGAHTMRCDGFWQGSTAQMYNSPGAGQVFQMLVFEVYG